MEMLIHQFVTIPSCLFTGCHWEDSVFFTPLSLLSRYLYTMIRFCQSLLFSRVKCPSSLSIFLSGRLVSFHFCLTVHLGSLCFIHLSIKVLWKTKVGKFCWIQDKPLLYSPSASCFLIHVCQADQAWLPLIHNNDFPSPSWLGNVL